MGLTLVISDGMPHAGPQRPGDGYYVILQLRREPEKPAHIPLILGIRKEHLMPAPLGQPSYGIRPAQSRNAIFEAYVHVRRDQVDDIILRIKTGGAPEDMIISYAVSGRFPSRFAFHGKPAHPSCG